MKETLIQLFARRMREELKGRGISRNALTRMCKDRGLNIGYGSISRILAGKQDPSLTKVEALSEAIGLPAWALMTDADQVEQRVIRPPTNVVRLPDPYPKIFGQKAPQPKAPQSGASAKQHSKKKR